MVATYLGFNVDGSEHVKVEFDTNEITSKTGALSNATYGTRALALMWSFRLEPNNEIDERNMGGILWAHKIANRRRPFAWPGVMLQPLGHDTTATDKTLTLKGDAHDETIAVNNALGWLVGRLIQVEGTTRLHGITRIVPTDADLGQGGPCIVHIQPGLRRAVAARATVESQPIPQVLYDPDLTRYDLSYGDRLVDTKISLLEA